MLSSASADSSVEIFEESKLLENSSVTALIVRPSRSRRPLLIFFGFLTLLVILQGIFSLRSSAPVRTRKLPGSLSETMAMAGKKALGGGLSGAVAGVAQVLTLMWLRTTMNYQYRYGSSMRATMRTLYGQGGVARFYQGLPYALLGTPLARFGDTAANTGVLALLAATALGASWPLWLRTAIASGTAALWRMLITPLDTIKTTLQVEGKQAYALLLRKAQRNGVAELWAGSRLIALVVSSAELLPPPLQRLTSLHTTLLPDL